jgi:hypothetical protein
MPLNTACSSDEKVPITAEPKSSSRRPALIDGPLRLEVLSGDGTFTQDPGEPLRFYVVSGDLPGETQYLVEADADLGEGMVLIQDVVILNVTSATAENLGFVSGPPELK